MLQNPPNENVELKARYNKLYTITVDGGHADVTSALTGKEITVDADVPDGKKFMGWKAEGITLTPAQQQKKHITFFMPEGNVTLTAEYKTLHTVTVIGADGTSTVLPDTYIEGDTVTVNAACAAVPAVTKGNQQLVFTVTQILRYIVCLRCKVLVAGKAAGG